MAEAPKTATASRMAEAVAFISAYCASDRDTASLLSCAQRDWLQASRFLDWVRDCGDVKAYEAAVARQNRLDAEAEADRLAVKEAEEAAKKRRVAEFGAKSPVAV